ETDEEKRIQGWKDVSAYIMENGYVIPLLQYVLPVVHSDKVEVLPVAHGDVVPADMKPAR
ncbi:MAG TPA: peptide ABC transporter substrate-binding protein, partial [Burkholderiaceae bacterium]|nr:peptide ABC transporter substrate-binding protein [Burkholderiaceae bacterium]